MPPSSEALREIELTSPLGLPQGEIEAITNRADPAWDEVAVTPCLPSRKLSAMAGCELFVCLLYTSPSPRDATLSRMPSSA